MCWSSRWSLRGRWWAAGTYRNYDGVSTISSGRHQFPATTCWPEAAANARFDTTLSPLPGICLIRDHRNPRSRRNDIMTEGRDPTDPRGSARRRSSMSASSALVRYSTGCSATMWSRAAASGPMAPKQARHDPAGLYLLVIACRWSPMCWPPRIPSNPDGAACSVALSWVCSGLAYAMLFTRVRFRLPFDWLLITGTACFWRQ